MKNQFNAITMAVGALIFVCGIAAGYFMKECPQRPPFDVDVRVGNFITLDTAHAYSARYRKSAGYCNSDSITCKFNLEGYFQMTEKDIDSLKKAVVEIKRAVQTAQLPIPEYFHFIYGREASWQQDNLVSTLLVAGVHPANDKEYVQYIKLIPTRLPCPRYCDARYSEIINKGSSLCR